MRIRKAVFLLAAALLLGRAALPGPAAPTATPETAVPADSKAELPANTKYVALTFDDGPRADTTARLLDGLRDRGARATFFLVGREIASNAALVLRMKAEGHQIGNHTWDHKNLQEMSSAAVEEEISKTDAALCGLLGEDEYWVRPPYGKIDRRQEQLFAVPIVKWSLDPWDWKLKNADKDVSTILTQVKSGDIVLMHDTVPESVDAALRIIDILQEQGYAFVTVKELLEKNGVTPCPGVMYYSDQRCA